jgi:hypothetical protein
MGRYRAFFKFHIRRRQVRTLEALNTKTVRSCICLYIPSAVFGALEAPDQYFIVFRVLACGGSELPNTNPISLFVPYVSHRVFDIPTTGEFDSISALKKLSSGLRATTTNYIQIQKWTK